MEEGKKGIDRRKFLKLLGAGAAVSVASFYGCKSNGDSEKNQSQGPVPTDKMTYRVNPKTGDKVSILGYGCMRWPTRPKKDGSGDEIDQEEVNRLVDYALAHGVNLFDTSPRYVQGLSETSTGIALHRHPRDKYFVSTKMSNFDPETQTKEASIDIYKNSLKALQVDYFDYYLLHSIGSKDVYQKRYLDNGILDFLLKEREAGRIRNLGWSFHGVKEFFDYMLNESGVKWDFVLIQLNYIDWRHASGYNVNADYLYAELDKRGIPIFVMEPLQGGRLSKLDFHSLEKLKQMDPNSNAASWAFRFAGSYPRILSVLSGMTYMEHLQDNIRTYSPLKPLSQKEMDILEDVAQLILQYPFVPCNECEYCMPCPYGLDIPGIFSHYNRCLKEGNYSENVNDENYKAARKAFLVGYDRSVPKLRQANHCTNCGICSPKCPQRIDIPNELQRIDRYVEDLKING